MFYALRHESFLNVALSSNHNDPHVRLHALTQNNIQIYTIGYIQIIQVRTFMYALLKFTFAILVHGHFQRPIIVHDIQHYTVNTVHCTSVSFVYSKVCKFTSSNNKLHPTIPSSYSLYSS